MGRLADLLARAFLRRRQPDGPDPFAEPYGDPYMIASEPIVSAPARTVPVPKGPTKPKR